MEELAACVLLRHPLAHVSTTVSHLRSVWSGSLRSGSWANSDAALHTKRALVETGLAKEDNGVISIIQDLGELSEEAAAKRRRLLDIPLDRRMHKGKVELIRSVAPYNT